MPFSSATKTQFLAFHVIILGNYNDVLLLWKLDHFNFPEYLTLSNSYLAGKYVILLCKHLLFNAYYFLYSGGEFILHYRFKIEVGFKEKIGNEVNASNKWWNAIPYINT